MKVFLAAGMCWLGCTAIAWSAPLDPADVPAGAVWVIHVDADQARTNPAAEKLRTAALTHAQLQKRIDFLRDRYGIDPRKDLHGMTFYGTSYAPHTGISVVRAEYDMDKVLKVMEKEPGYRTSKHGDHTIYSWEAHHHHHHHHAHHPEAAAGPESEKSGKAETRKEKKEERKEQKRDAKDDSKKDVSKKDDSKKDDAKTDKPDAKAEKHEHPHMRVAAAYPSKSVAIVGVTEENVIAALDLLAGKGESLKAHADSPLLGKMVPGTIMHGAAVKLQGLEGRPREFAVLGQTEQIQINAGAEGDAFFFTSDVLTKSPETAKQLQAVTEGVKALVQLHCSGHKLPDLSKGLTTKLNGNSLVTDWRTPTATLLEVAEIMKQKHEARHAEKIKADQPHGDKPKADKPKADKPKADKPEADNKGE